MLYTIVFIIVLYLCRIKRTRYKIFPKLKLNKQGIIFYSKSNHRIKIDNLKFIVVKDMVYIDINANMFILKNVKNVHYYKNYLYFTCLGDCKFYFDTKLIYKYFNIKIESDYLDIENLKQLALLDMINNKFRLNSSRILNKYINVIKNILNINISDKEIVIKENKYRIPFVLIYKVNNKIKKIKVEETF